MFAPDDNAVACERLLTSERALFIGAHPDDIEFRAGGLVHLMKQRGAQVTFAIATRGGRSWPSLLRIPLEKTRERQQHDAASILGGISIVFYDYPDGSLQAHVEALTQDLMAVIADLRPDIVLCWDPEHPLTSHPDHQAAAEAALAATGGLETCWYGTTEPNLWVGMGEDALQAKVRALKAHRTETPCFYFDMRLKKRMIETMRQEGAKTGSNYAETFRVTRRRPPIQP